MSEVSQPDNRPTLGSGVPPVDPAQYLASSPFVANEGNPKSMDNILADERRMTMNKCEDEKTALDKFYKNKLKQKTYVVIASLAVSALIAVGGGYLVNRLLGISPSQALLDSSKQNSDLETVVAGLKATGTRLSAENANAISSNNTISSTLGICQLNLKDTISELNQRKANDNIIYTTATSVFNQNITLTERLNVISNTVLSPSEIISRMALALTNGDQETIRWLNEVGCVVPPTETPLPTSTTMVLPSWTPSRTPINTATPSATPTIVITPPENATDTPVPGNTPTKGPEATFPVQTRTAVPTWTQAPSATLPPTFTPEHTRTPIPTLTSVPTVTKAAEATFPAQTRTVTP